MLGLGWSEMMVIGVVALIVIGPKDLPLVMNKIGKVVGQIRRMGADFQREINRSASLDEVRNIRTTISNPLKATAESIRKEFNTTTSTGAVKPSGVLKPADPKAESVVNEIKQAVGMAPVNIAAKPLPKREIDAKAPTEALEAGEPVVAVPDPSAPSETVKINAVPAPPPAEPVKAARPVAKPAKTAATTSAAIPAPKAEPKAAEAKATESKSVAGSSAVAKPAARTRAKAAEAETAPAKVARKPRTAATTTPDDAVPAAPRRSRVAEANTPAEPTTDTPKPRSRAAKPKAE
jgi:sec-independent protein translocase protein TatB